MPSSISLPLGLSREIITTDKAGRKSVKGTGGHEAFKTPLSHHTLVLISMGIRTTTIKQDLSNRGWGDGSVAKILVQRTGFSLQCPQGVLPPP